MNRTIHFQKTGSTVALLNKIQANETQLDRILVKTEIAQKIPNLFLAKILVAELMFGRGKLNGRSKPVECVLSHHEQLKEALAELGEAPNQQTKLQQFNGNYSTAILMHVSAFLTGNG